MEMKKYKVNVYFNCVDVEVEAENEDEAMAKAMSEVDNDSGYRYHPDIDEAEIVEELK